MEKPFLLFILIAAVSCGRDDSGASSKPDESVVVAEPAVCEIHLALNEVTTGPGMGWVRYEFDPQRSKLDGCKRRPKDQLIFNLISKDRTYSDNLDFYLFQTRENERFWILQPFHSLFSDFLLHYQRDFVIDSYDQFVIGLATNGHDTYALPNELIVQILER